MRSFIKFMSVFANVFRSRIYRVVLLILNPICIIVYNISLKGLVKPAKFVDYIDYLFSDFGRYSIAFFTGLIAIAIPICLLLGVFGVLIDFIIDLFDIRPDYYDECYDRVDYTDYEDEKTKKQQLIEYIATSVISVIYCFTNANFLYGIVGLVVTSVIVICLFVSWISSK